MKLTFFVKTALLALSASLCAPFASASTITISGTDTAGDSYSATLTLSPGTYPGSYNVSDVSGTVTRVPTGTVAIDSMASAFSGPYSESNPANSPSGAYFYDDIYYGSGDADGNPYDGAGLLFVLDGGKEVNLYCQDTTTSCYFEENDGLPQEQLTSFYPPIVNTPPPAVPEPGTLALFGTGVLGLAGAIRRRITA